MNRNRRRKLKGNAPRSTRWIRSIRAAIREAKGRGFDVQAIQVCPDDLNHYWRATGRPIDAILFVPIQPNDHVEPGYFLLGTNDPDWAEMPEEGFQGEGFKVVERFQPSDPNSEWKEGKNVPEH